MSDTADADRAIAILKELGDEIDPETGRHPDPERLYERLTEVYGIVQGLGWMEGDDQ